MESLKLIELRRNPQLINANFDGYKLSLKPIPKLEYKLQIGPDQSSRTNDQYSLHHVQLFGMQNHLVSDPWEPYSVYFVDLNWTIQNVKYNTGTGELVSPVTRHEITKWDRNYGDYNITMRFVSEKYCILSNGCGQIRIFNTGDRYRGVQWQCVHTGAAFVDDPERKSIIADARFESIDGKSVIAVVVVSIEQIESKFENCLDLVKMCEQPNGWTVEHVTQLRGKSLPVYCELEPKSRSLLVAGNHRFVFGATEGDKENMDCGETNGCENGNDEPVTVPYTWTQTDEDVTINFPISKTAEKDDFKVTCEGKRITVLYNNETLMTDNLCRRVESGLTTWHLENESLQLNLVKTDCNTEWPKLIEADEDIQATRNAIDNEPQRDTSAMASVAFQSGLEDCDYESEGADSEYYIERFDVFARNVTHKISLGMHRPLFAIQLRPNYSSAIALRHDVDACIWQPQLTASDWLINHEGTLNAFGYVQASKQQKKFQQCSPNFNYAIICETNRNIFIYYSRFNTDGELKNRKGGKSAIGEQKLVTLDGGDEILGINCMDDVTILLTENSVICLQINVRSE